MEHFIPAAWLQGQPQWILLTAAAIAIGFLIKGADLLVEAASKVAYRLGISKVIVGATIVSLGTTSPECAVSVMAAWSGNPGLALGNAVGSIIADTALIFGVGCLLTRLPADRFVLSRQGWVQFGSAAALAAVVYFSYAISGPAAEISRVVGIAFLALLGLYLYYSIQWSRAHPPPDVDPAAVSAEEQTSLLRSWPLLLSGILGLTLVLFASRVLILSVTELAEVHWKVPQVVIAATLVALGTSLPELVVGITAIMKGQKEILVGNVIGADVLIVLFVVGASASAAPLPIIEPGASNPYIALTVHIPTMMMVLIMFRLFIWAAVKEGSFQRWYGWPLVATYVGYTILQFLVS